MGEEFLRYQEEIVDWGKPDCSDSVVATAEYGKELTAAVQQGNVMGCQFHPEKSGQVGLAILRAFCDGEESV